MRLHDLIETNARETPDHVFAELGDTQLTYSEANAIANQFARALVDANIGHGERFAFLAKNSLEYCVMYFAASKCGAIPIPLNYRLAPAEWAYIIHDSGAKLVWAADEFNDGINSIKTSIPSVTSFVTSTPKPQPPWLNHSEWIANKSTDNLDLPVSENDQLYQMYTSGTTGNPKGVIVTQQAVLANLQMQVDVVEAEKQADRVLLVLPMYHAAGAVACLMLQTMQANTLVVVPEFEPKLIIDIISTKGITIAGLVPAMIQACLIAVPDIEKRDYSSLRMFGYGASPIAAETLKRAMDIFQCRFYQMFGMTETVALLTQLNGDDHLRAVTDRPELLRSAGKAASNTEIKIVANSKEVPRGTVGEIVARGPQLMTGYWNLPEATASSLKDGWMYTGDAAYMSDDGYIFIQDRIKDMVVSGGENIYPAEVENALFQHPQVADAAVIGIPDDKWGESLLAFIVAKGEEPDKEALSAFCREQLASYKIPRQFKFLESIPRNASGKILKKILREPYWKGRERRVG
jgi:acyl-CoA synthetase (AMP-forming)/AMP-acid ligase II